MSVIWHFLIFDNSVKGHPFPSGNNTGWERAERLSVFLLFITSVNTKWGLIIDVSIASFYVGSLYSNSTYDLQSGLSFAVSFKCLSYTSYSSMSIRSSFICLSYRRRLYSILDPKTDLKEEVPEAKSNKNRYVWLINDITRLFKNIILFWDF